MLKVFVYGTLKPGECNYQRLCAGKVLREERAIAYGALFSLPMGYPAMTSGNTPIQGYLLTFADPDILSALDRLEGYHPNRPMEQNEYNRQLIETLDLTEQLLGTAWAYFMSFERVRSYGGILLGAGCWNSTADATLGDRGFST